MSAPILGSGNRWRKVRLSSCTKMHPEKENVRGGLKRAKLHVIGRENVLLSCDLLAG